MSTTPTTAVPSDQRDGSFAWLRSLGKPGRRAFAGAFGGYALDAYDLQVLPMSLGAVTAFFHISTGQGGLLNAVTLVVSALGGALAGILIDRIGRTRTLLVTVGTYALFTALCGFAPNFPALLVLRSLQGLGFGGEWAAGAILVAEYATTRHRGRTVAYVQSAWAVGWGLAAIVSTVVFYSVPAAFAWRIMFWTGALPALLVLFLRRRVTDAPIARSTARSTGRRRGSFLAIMRGGLGRRTFFASLLATGVQGGYYTLNTWIPLYLAKGRGLNVVHTGGYTAILVTGSFAGYVTGGYVTDLLGRKRAFALFAVLAAILIVLYTRIPSGANTAVLILGFPLGFAASAIFSGFGAFLAELYPTELRGTGQGFTYNFGRAVGAFFPTVIGFLAADYGIGGAMAFGAVGYAIAVLALLGLPETRTTELPT